MGERNIANRLIYEYLQTRQKKNALANNPLQISTIRNIVICFTYTHFSKYCNFRVELPKETNNKNSCQFLKQGVQEIIQFQSRFQ